jgi:hypothetical protein
MGKNQKPSADPQAIFSSGRAGTNGQPDLRILHYNDVYHVDPSSAEPVGGISRFMTVCSEYREDAKYKDQSKLLTFFSGDAFNPSLESTVTKGKHMVPILNAIGTDCACVGVGSPIRASAAAAVLTWLARITTLTLARSSSAAWQTSASFPGCSPMSSTPPSARMCRWATPRRRT